MVLPTAAALMWWGAALLNQTNPSRVSVPAERISGRQGPAGHYIAHRDSVPLAEFKAKLLKAEEEMFEMIKRVGPSKSTTAVAAF